MTSDRDDLFRLFQSMLQGDISAEDHQRLQQRLRDDAAARSLWYRYCDVETGLTSARLPSAQSQSDQVRPVRRIVAWASAAAATILAVVWIGLATHESPLPAFATLTAANNARWADPNTELMLRGAEVPSGRLILESGRAEFLFSSGARVSVEGPADFAPVDARRLSLRRGKVLCQCLEDQSRITVITPQVAVTDLGTEFAVEVDHTSTTRVAVISGSVSIGTQASAQQLDKGQMAVIGDDHVVRVAAQKRDDFAGLMRLEPFRSVNVVDQANLLVGSSFAGDFPGPWLFSAGYCTRVEGRGVAGAAAVRIRSLGSRYWPLISQRVAVHDAAGQLAVGSIAALNPADDPLGTSQCAIVKLVCRDAQDREFAHAECHFQHANQPRDRYVRAQVRLVVPPGTVSIELQALLNATGLASGSLYVDEPALFLIPQFSEPNHVEPVELK
jgi:FecR protein